MTSQKIPKNPIFAGSEETEGSELSPRQLAAAELLALGKSLSQTAYAVGVDRRTLFTWRKGDAFQQELQRQHQELWGDEAQRLRMLIHPSLEVLVENLNDARGPNRFRAASTILRLANFKELCKSGAPS